MKKCSICSEKIQEHKTPKGKVYWSDGHNAQPINDGRCCDHCNDKVVIPARLESFFKSQPAQEIRNARFIRKPKKEA